MPLAMCSIIIIFYWPNIYLKNQYYVCIIPAILVLLKMKCDMYMQQTHLRSMGLPQCGHVVPFLLLRYSLNEVAIIPVGTA